MARYLTKEQTELWTTWIKALKSGQYKQAKGALKSSAGNMCCLGVACDLVKGKGILNSQLDESTIKKFGFQNKLGFNVGEFENLLDKDFECPSDFFATDIAGINDILIDKKKRDYSNVLPYIEAYFNKYKSKR